MRVASTILDLIVFLIYEQMGSYICSRYSKNYILIETAIKWVN